MTGDCSDQRAVTGILSDRQTADEIAWCVIASLNHDGDLRGAGKASGVLHGVGKDIAQRLARGSQCLNQSVAVIDRVRVAAVGGDLDGSVIAADRGADVPGRGADRSGCDTRDRLGIAAIHVDVIGEEIARWIRSVYSIVGTASFHCVCSIRNRNRGIIECRQRDVSADWIAIQGPVVHEECDRAGIRRSTCRRVFRGRTELNAAQCRLIIRGGGSTRQSQHPGT